MHIVNGVLTKSAFCAVRVLTVFFGAGLIATAFAGSPGDSKKEVQAVQPALCDPPWYISLGLGLDIDTGVNSFVNGTTFSPFGGAGRSLYTEDLKGRSYNDVYDNSIYRIQAEVGYVLTNHVELFGTFKYAGGYGKKQYGDRDIYANFTTYSLVSYPGLYRSYGGELGLRYFFFSKEMSQPWRIRPYISVAGGATHVDHIGDVLYQSSNGFYSYAPFIKGRLYNDSWVGTGEFLVGAEVPLSCHWSVGLDAGIRYQSPLDPSSDITRYNYRGIPYQVSDQHYNHDAGDRLYVPVTGYIKFRF